MKESKTELALITIALVILAGLATLALLMDKISAEQWMILMGGAGTGLPALYAILRTWFKRSGEYAKINGTKVPNSPSDSRRTDT